MANYGKKFEELIKEALNQVDNISVDRLYDPAGGYGGLKNICDFQAYKFPISFYFECKSTAGGTLSFGNITQNQLSGMLEKSKIKGVKAGFIIWWYEKDVTAFIDVRDVQALIETDSKSIAVKNLPFIHHINLTGKKKRIFYDYDGNDFIEKIVKESLAELI